MTETWAKMRRRHSDERNALIIAALDQCGGNESAAARLLEMDRANLHRLVATQQLVIKPPKQPKEKREEWHIVK